MTETMTRGEREDLQRLTRQRGAALKSAAKLRSAELLAEFDAALAAQFHYDDDAVWSEATRTAEAEVTKANARIAARCREMGIPKQFAPRLAFGWSSRRENEVKERRAELRTAARSRIEAIERQAVVQIDLAAVEAQTQLAMAGLTSEAARVFVTILPTVESLMPALSYQEIAGEAEPSVVEQLVTPNALRQRRHREKQAALHNADVTPGNATPPAPAALEEAPR